MTHHQHPKTGGTPTFTPKQNDSKQVDAQGRVQVRVNDQGANNNTYVATITDIATGATVGSGSLALENPSGSPHFFSGLLSAGSVPTTSHGSNNKTAKVRGSQGAVLMFSDQHDFEAYGSGSGSSTLAAGAAQVAQVFQPSQPVPRAVLLEFEARAGTSSQPGDQSQEPKLLLHAPDSEYVSWLSEPLDLGCEAQGPAFWKLQKRDAWTWVLILRRGNNLLVSYRHTTAVERDGSLPIRLQVVDLDGTAGKDWPRTVTLSAAP